MNNVLSTHCIPGPVLGTGNTVVNRPKSLPSWQRQRVNAIPSGGGGGRDYELNQQGEMTLSDCWGWAWLLIWWQERVFWGCETWGEIWSKRRNLPWEDQRVNSPIRGKQTQKLWGSSMLFQPTGSPLLDEMCKQLFSKFMWGGWMGEGWDIASGHLWMPVDVSGASYW